MNYYFVLEGIGSSRTIIYSGGLLREARRRYRLAQREGRQVVLVQLLPTS